VRILGRLWSQEIPAWCGKNEKKSDKIGERNPITSSVLASGIWYGIGGRGGLFADDAAARDLLYRRSIPTAAGPCPIGVWRTGRPEFPSG